MERILIVLHGPIDVELLRRRCGDATSGVSGPYELAVCHVLDDGKDGLEDSIRVQRALTAALREALGTRAEDVAVFVASDHHGYRSEDCARDWGATLVLA